ncbi:SH3 domain-containing protein [Acuticoccus sp. MNP-M23]|uniref:SH3 domain-containing protein n=1 Tax=Acuticoccus sp. MNP-M23 TaxID=3072793 RepID=UPI0028169B25|nr:SH3 domain-containing protein [Acuticoccus sp. MNP-M23]WMS42340.1 SH3 domain-containing protein [Acuticoccus sp. MNP-M23]
MKRTAIIAIGLMGAIGAATAQPLDVPVMIGAEADLDACTGVGRIARLDPNGDGFLAVRRGPEAGYAKIDELYNNDVVTICDENGGWYGIVYGQNCGTSSPVPRPMAYSGPCRNGWVYGRYVDYIAG